MEGSSGDIAAAVPPSLGIIRTHDLHIMGRGRASPCSFFSGSNCLRVGSTPPGSPAADCFVS